MTSPLELDSIFRQVNGAAKAACFSCANGCSREARAGDPWELETTYRGDGLFRPYTCRPHMMMVLGSYKV